MQILPIPFGEEQFGMGSTQISHSSLLPVMDIHDYDMVSEGRKRESPVADLSPFKGHAIISYFINMLS